MISVLSFFILIFIYHQNTKSTAISNAKANINELLLNYKAFRSYVSNVQKEEVYKLQKNGHIDQEYFNPTLLSSTFSAKNVNNIYNTFKESMGEKPIVIRFASDNPRNVANKANQEESILLKKFNSNELHEYTKIIEDYNGTTLYYVLPTKRTTNKCMRCHSDPSIAPQGLVEIYGDKNGFYENVGEIRAILSTSYPLDKDLANANKTFWILTIATFIIFAILLLIVFIFSKEIREANKTLDDKVNSRTKELEDEKEYIRTILDVNPSIILVTNNMQIVNANKQFFNLFDCNNIEEFKKEVQCIGDYFVGFDKKAFPEDGMISGKIWSDYLVESSQLTHYVTIEYKGTIHDYIISGAKLNGHGDTLITLHNITEQLRKDKLLFEQSKLASMGEMIGNIAHQWRQPLSIISTSATGMQIQKEYGILDDEKLHSGCETINENAQYLSKTIDDFRNFIRGDREKKEFNLKEDIQSFLQLVESTTKAFHIKVILELEDNVMIHGYPNELIQCFMNIFNNSKDILKDIDEHDRYIFIKTYRENSQIIIKIKDNAGGIPAEVLPKIFEPYFTTKHQSQGTGLGLHMTYNLITDGMKGTIIAHNVKYIYEDKGYTGAEFVITLPL